MAGANAQFTARAERKVKKQSLCFGGWSCLLQRLGQIEGDLGVLLLRPQVYWRTRERALEVFFPSGRKKSTLSLLD